MEAQFSVINSILVNDFDRDGQDDILLAGNHFGREVETTRSDASYGLLLSWNDQTGNFTSKESGALIGGDVRSMSLLRQTQKNLIVIAKNNDQASVFAEFQVNE